MPTNTNQSNVAGQFARFLLDRIEDKTKGLPEQASGEIRLHLKELRGVIDSTFGPAPARSRNGGPDNA